MATARAFLNGPRAAAPQGSRPLVGWKEAASRDLVQDWARVQWFSSVEKAEGSFSQLHWAIQVMQACGWSAESLPSASSSPAQAVAA